MHAARKDRNSPCHSSLQIEEAEYELDLFEEKDTFEHSWEAWEHMTHHQPDQRLPFIVRSNKPEDCHQFLHTQEELMDYLAVFMESAKDRPAFSSLRSQMALYHCHCSRRSFLYLLAENCFDILAAGRCQQWLHEQTILTALMMVDPERYELAATGRRVNPRRLLLN